MNMLRCFARFAGWFGILAGASAVLAQSPVPDRERELPEPLKAWAQWATWDAKDRHCPAPYNDSKQTLRFWPSQLDLQVNDTAGRFTLGVTAYAEAWVPLPGGSAVWPMQVTSNGMPIPVVEHQGGPAVKLAAGSHDLAGGWQWPQIPQRIPLPAQIGILSLTLRGQAVEAPVWDAKGFLWLQRDGSTEEIDKDFLGVKLHAVIEDGIPLWLRTELELIVAGKSREEEIGVVLPDGWKLAAVDGPIPVAIDAAGRMKAQVRAGKWVVKVDAFRLDHPEQVAYAADAKPAVSEELIAFRSRPEFRLVELSGLPMIDVSQTPFPKQWRDLPVYQWNTAKPFRLEERMRGMGVQKPEGLRIARELWLDDNGRGLTFRDQITGTMQQVWRLDAAEGQDLGSVRADGEGQLITLNPANGAPGVEVRGRAIDLKATGRMTRSGEFSATGWRTDADELDVTLNLPPGWRLFALFGADRIHGDWLTSWTLLDLFLLLIFSLAVFRLWGFWAALLAFLAFGLSYHEPGAPRYVWLVLLMPIALIRVVPAGWGRHILNTWKWGTVVILVMLLVPFVARQIQQSIYPQLESTGSGYPRYYDAPSIVSYSAAASQIDSDPFGETVQEESDAYSRQSNKQAQRTSSLSKANLMWDSKAVIQVGPGVPERSWRTVSFGWNGPVQAEQQARPLLIPPWLERSLSLLRAGLLVVLAGFLLSVRKLRGSLRANNQATAVLAGVLALALIPKASAQMPDQQILDSLRDRLMEKSDAYPTAADIPMVTLSVHDRTLAMDAEIHTAITTAVPLPGRLPAWSPVSVQVNGQAQAVLRRDDGFLWIVLPAGVHQVQIEGTLLHRTEWEWAFQLKPRRVVVEAPGWNVSGVKPDGSPEAQVFFSRKLETSSGEASYDRPDVQSAVGVDRHIELGLVWQVRTTAKRLSPDGKAVALRVPLLPGEQVVTSNLVVKDGFAEVRLGAHQPSFTWESELTLADTLRLETKPADDWVERWHLVASPVWNVAYQGIAPVFDASNSELVPVWQPWPGEGVELAINRPKAVPGETVTVRQGEHEISLGRRQRSSTLTLDLQCSLGEDFLIGLPADAETNTLTHNGRAIPVRKDGNQVIVPLQPGRQNVVVGWKTDMPLGFRTRAAEVRLPVESANIDTRIRIPNNRWVLWADGPMRGPAVRFWVILAVSLLAAWVLGRVARSPLHTIEWMLLAIGLTQIHLLAALTVIAWLFVLRWRGSDSFRSVTPSVHNLLQICLIGLTAVVLGIFIAVVAAGLLGNPEMFIRGNGSSRTMLQWHEARSGTTLPVPGCVSVSIWWYRFLMLVWALWLAASLIRWLRWAWQQFSSGGSFRKMGRGKNAPVETPPAPGPPPLAGRETQA